MEAIKPKVCDLLGVELDEEFEFKFDGINYRFVQFFDCDDPDGWYLERKLRNDSWTQDVDVGTLIDMIEYPEKVAHIGCIDWTEKDIADAKAVKQLYSYADEIVKISDDGSFRLLNSQGGWLSCLTLAASAFPSMPKGKPVKLSDIIGGAE